MSSISKASAEWEALLRHEKIHYQCELREVVGRHNRALEDMSLVLKSAVVALHKGKTEVVDELLDQVIYDINRQL